MFNVIKLHLYQKLQKQPKSASGQVVLLSSVGATPPLNEQLITHTEVPCTKLL